MRAKPQDTQQKTMVNSSGYEWRSQ